MDREPWTVLRSRLTVHGPRSNAHCIVSVTLVECDVPPLVPVTVMVRVPVVARLLTRMFMVEEPAPVIEVGLNETVTRLPCPDADRAMAELNPPVTAVLTVTLPEVPRRTVIAVGLALIEKPADVLVTVRPTVVVCVCPPPVPVTVIV